MPQLSSENILRETRPLRLFGFAVKVFMPTQKYISASAKVHDQMQNKKQMSLYLWFSAKISLCLVGQCSRGCTHTVFLGGSRCN